ncbi:Resolvase, N terminal domain [Paracoccus sp. J56]|nr:Resolvase, N terminal domain [Paracoccus sp. J56]
MAVDNQPPRNKDAGCDKLFQDHGATGSNMDRPGLEKVLRALKPGDTLVVWRLDRLGRSLTDLVRFIEELGERGCEFRSLNEAIDTSTSGGRLIFHIMAAFAEFERNLISERTRAGLIAARQRFNRTVGGNGPAVLPPRGHEGRRSHHSEGLS